MIGLTCDGLMDTSMFNLYKGCDVYFTDDSYYASYPFPNEWIEMFKGNRANEMMEEDANMDLNEILKYKRSTNINTQCQLSSSETEPKS